MASRSSKRKVGVSEEPCTLIYILNKGSKLPFEHFSLIVRSLHTYMVSDIKPDVNKQCVYVKLDYQASVKNATAKLGKLTNDVTISKMSAFVEETELGTLAELRALYGFGANDDCDKEVPAPRAHAKRVRYTTGPQLFESDPEQEYK